jgi:hypothetical protein
MPRPRFRGLEGKAEPASASLSPVAREYPSRALGEHFSPPHYDCSIKERRRHWDTRGGIEAFVLYIFFTAETGE